MPKTLLLLSVVVALAAAPTAATASDDPFTGSWTATDDDGSTLVLAISAANPAGVRHVTLVDQFATACGAPATAIGVGTAVGSMLVTTADVRCGGEPFANDATISYELVDDTLVIGTIVFTRSRAD